MIFSLYLLSVLYTNSMGLIIISKCNPIINKEIETKGYIKKDLSDSELVKKTIKDCALFFIPGYYLKKALDLTSKDFDIDKIIEEKVKSGEVISINEREDDTKEVDSIFKKETKLSLGKYEKPSIYKAISNEESMYTDIRYPNKDEIDIDFWEEDKDLKPYLETEVISEEIKKEPVKEYLDSISEEELLKMVEQIEMIRRLKKDSEKFLNNKAA